MPIIPINKRLFGNIEKCLYICITKRNEDVFIIEKKQHKRLYSDQEKIFGNIENYLYICFNKKIKIFMATFNKNAEMANGMFDTANLDNESIVIENNTITFYHLVHTERGMEWLSFNVNGAYACGEIVQIMHKKQQKNHKLPYPTALIKIQLKKAICLQRQVSNTANGEHL